MSNEITELINNWAAKMNVAGKMGRKVLQPSLAMALRAAGFRADEEDQACVLQPGMPVWRNKEDATIEPTALRRRVDIVVYRDNRMVAMIETESDLNDLRPSGITRRNGHYDVWSIARAGNDEYFDSYKSLERMAAAAFYWDKLRRTGQYPSAADATMLLGCVHSDQPSDHNPGAIPLILVSGSCRGPDEKILVPRLRSLGASLICVSTALR
jgi:hypothetical protein